mmetsp:Transcript_9334/g.13604  ORF Transcript_9334/g.13604 Transcript_9334/m.13604 type:complete len:261 (+) Transcript_9334:417-1199(+)|eukprot:CAMPEP_0195516042 /NCGR_PEP_ID=MMETSP0794_2-20130614/6897_1 /TAXON_ID=515487 /ORGANISM="Stephanopyxis turris, Strain CCMP 815" /LENGTH=260 /DNA_ID=CAMNT_0040644553 /DNA_START=318 /DNA_END=1100 /DNA_ORIENTATION=+
MRTILSPRRYKFLPNEDPPSSCTIGSKRIVFSRNTKEGNGGKDIDGTGSKRSNTKKNRCPSQRSHRVQFTRAIFGKVLTLDGKRRLNDSISIRTVSVSPSAENTSDGEVALKDNLTTNILKTNILNDKTESCRSLSHSQNEDLENCNPLYSVADIVADKGMTREHRIRKSMVTFQCTQSVIPIPELSEYSEGERMRVWGDPDEVYSNKERNKIEFAAEGWNWRNVIEEDEMIMNPKTGDKIHPVHLRDINNILICEEVEV